MKDYDQIKVTFSDYGKLEIENSVNLPLIGSGGHGAVFKLDEQRCIKIYANEDIAEKEKQVYLRTLGSPIMPILYETGDNYLIIEYINGPNLKDFLLLQGVMPPYTVRELINMFLEMNRLCFMRRDESLRHILIKGDGKIKIIDNYYAFTLHDPAPVKFFRQLEKIKMLETFIKEGSVISPSLFKEFGEYMPEYFK